ncbi:hypothetical protein GCM10010524_32930 [Streptomyces mexicanus]
MGERRIIMSAHMRVVSEQSMSARMICIWAWPPICMQELMASSQRVWQVMQASTQSCISLLRAVAVPGWVWVTAPPGGRERGPGVDPVPLRRTPGRRFLPSGANARPAGAVRVTARPAATPQRGRPVTAGCAP